ncbi:peptidyl-tRNA hydrolase, PTH1 family [Desulfosarcina sp. BuS5]|uniref:aminoacyl-tRNA hydrolase n=1 Tax=Desulfosarcina sp. BuS5 TaxID=933262 RepID=UPI000684FEB2|nr:aminoacyl-tRNA hydrolase [Desulfosarcina sp. BuS5]WDN90553.1 peptidyl-tRNA hydrolase, PTH1 family [Desulfosarcina sp. BuS5]
MADEIRLVIGLGNPGEQYRKTRHNAGFMVIDAISNTFAIALDKKKFDAEFGRGSIEGVEVILVKPQSFMNRSGPPVQKLAAYFKISTQDILVIHDDIDLNLGRLKIKEKGGGGGHNGIKSLINALNGVNFSRLRIGIGRPNEHMGIIDHVLGRFTSGESEVMELTIARAKEAVVEILCNGIKEGMNRFNVNFIDC